MFPVFLIKKQESYYFYIVLLYRAIQFAPESYSIKMYGNINRFCLTFPDKTKQQLY